MIPSGSTITLDVEKPAAGGRMLARHGGQVVLVWGAIPGERVAARVERSGKGVVYADAVEIVSASPDRREIRGDWRCGGNVYAHVAYPRQLQLKGEVIRDAFARIGRLPVAAPEVIGSPESGYRMRARLHARDGRLGFFREGTHDLCAVSATGQLLPETIEWLDRVQAVVRDRRLSGLGGVEIAENVPASERACHLELHAGAESRTFERLIDAGPLTGLSATVADRGGVEVLTGTPSVCDVLHVTGDPSGVLRLRRDARAFFQGNRFLLERLVRHVLGLLDGGPVLDLYAGVGLFGLSAAAAGHTDVTLVEGDLVSGADLHRNAEPFGDRVQVRHSAVEAFLRSARTPANTTFIVDPPRTGMSRDAVAGIIARKPARLVYVSCDVATFGRDTRTFVDAGYQLRQLTGFDLFPNTAHVESVGVLTRTA
jgi:tRNA/tmRNA/rRNA uracil-C5-methylase (TrmA/RlmC/RlmD family)